MGKNTHGHKIIPPEDILQYEFDKVIICIYNIVEEDKVFKQLLDLKIDPKKIVAHKVSSYNTQRVIDLKKIADELCSVGGEVAECGVYRGGFAGHINEVFPDRKLYLFDTFGSLDAGDISKEDSDVTKSWLGEEGRWVQYGSEAIALARCPFREKVIIRKGHVPETFVGLEKERFAFVHLDMDLYQPHLAALRFFTPRMSSGGIILVHDYYHIELPGVKKAIDEFANEYKFVRIPTCDVFTIALGGFEKK